jgi:hypothetical protein
VGTLIAAVSYVLLNSAYLEFYESLGTRPEDVGLDRLAVLGRISGIVIDALLLAAGIALIALFAILSVKRKKVSFGATLIPIWPIVKVISPLAWQQLRRRVLFIGGILASFLIIGAVLVATASVGRLAERAEEGIPVSPLGPGPFAVVHVSADAARVLWLDKETVKPAVLNDPWLLYLGRSKEVAVFLACGRTVIVPADKVVPIVLTTEDDRNQARGDLAARKLRCDAYTS